MDEPKAVVEVVVDDERQTFILEVGKPLHMKKEFIKRAHKLSIELIGTKDAKGRS